MKCNNIVDGKVCGTDILPPSRFCGMCGGTGIIGEGKTCCQELDHGMSICPKSGTDKKKSLQGEEYADPPIPRNVKYTENRKHTEHRKAEIIQDIKQKPESLSYFINFKNPLPAISRKEQSSGQNYDDEDGGNLLYCSECRTEQNIDCAKVPQSPRNGRDTENRKPTKLQKLDTRPGSSFNNKNPLPAISRKGQSSGQNYDGEGEPDPRFLQDIDYAKVPQSPRNGRDTENRKPTKLQKLDTRPGSSFNNKSPLPAISRKEQSSGQNYDGEGEPDPRFSQDIDYAKVPQSPRNGRDTENRKPTKPQKLDMTPGSFNNKNPLPVELGSRNNHDCEVGTDHRRFSRVALEAINDSENSDIQDMRPPKHQERDKIVNNARREQCVQVTFHCVVAPSMLKSLEKNTLYVVFEESFIEDRNTKKYQMNEIRTLADNYREYVGIVSVHKQLTCRPQKYNYVMMQREEEVFEYVYSRITKNHTKRTLNISESNIKKGEYHIFDGVIREKPNESKWKQFKGLLGFVEYKNVLKGDVNIAGKTFLPSWQISSFADKSLNGEDLINYMKFVFDGLEEVYCNLAGLWKASDFYQTVGSMLKPILLEVLDTLHEKRSIETNILHLVTSITMAYLVMKYDIDINSRERNMLCELLLPLIDFEQTQPYDMNTLMKFFPQTRQLVSEGVLNFSRMIASKTSNPKWMYCLPIIHFLYGKCVPYKQDDVKVNHDDAIPEWWGIAEYKCDIEIFKSKAMSWDCSADQVLQALFRYFKMDYLLPRSFLTALKQEQILDVVRSGWFPSDVILAVIFYYTKTSCSSEILKTWFTQVLAQNIEVNLKEIPFADALRSCKIAADVIKYSLKKNTDIKLDAMECFLVSIDIYDKLQIDQWNMDEHLTFVKEITLDFCQCLSCDFSGDQLQYLKRWNDALKFRIPNGRIRKIYLKCVKDNLKAGIEKLGSHNKLMEIYLLECETFDDTVKAILSEVAVKAVTNCGNLDAKIMGNDQAVVRLSELINIVQESSWEKGQDRSPHQTLEHILTCATFPTIIQMYYKLPQNLTFVQKSVEILKTLARKLVDGEIMVHDLKTILEKKDSFIKNIQAIEDIDKKTIVYINLREKEFQTYKKTEQLVQEFTDFIFHCKGDTTQLCGKLKTLKNVDEFPLSQLVNTHTGKEVDLQNYKPFVTFFELTCDQLKQLPDIIECSKSLLFKQLWEESGKAISEQKKRLLTTQEVFSEVWGSTLSQWKNLSEKLIKGDLLFSEFEKYFGNTESECLRSELLLVVRGGKTEWVKERLDQLNEYRNLKSCVFGAEIILDVVKAFELKGNFSQVLTITDYIKFGNIKMNKLDKSLLKTCSILRDVTNERAECLKNFIKCKPLVDWLRKSMRNGLQELKVFVDLASISAGEGAMEIDKVNCFHSATTGYGSLIFGLKQNCDTKKFLEKCQEVWKELVSDPHLPKKLIDTNRNLTWLQTVKKSHGSVEVNSLQQAERINRRGTYHVGNLTKSTNVRKATLTEVLELHVAGDDGNDKILYNCEQLYDLQSRLMLVAGKAEKGKDEVDCFMMIFDSVVRLAKIYIRLVEEGCVLFSQWHLKLVCNKEERTYTSIIFGQGENRQKLKARIEEKHHDVSAIILKIAKVLEDCHEKWLTYITQNRENYHLLNFFTIDQMVILQQELIKLESSQEPSVLIYPLLSAVKKECTKSNLVQAVVAAKTDLKRGKLEKQKEMDEENDKEWQGKNTSDNEPIEYDLYDEEPETRNIVNQLGVESGKNEIEKLKKALEDIWESFLTSVSSSVSDSQYLSVEHLGLILNRLAEKETFIVNRTFLPCFKVGEPNLIICHQSEIYNTVLSVYSHEGDTPLPQSDEVLLCTQHTTLEMVEIFWRRALYTDNNKIYCLVNADLLDYDVSDKGENALERHLKCAFIKGKKYKLVVICSSENEYKSRIAAALDKYHRSKIPTAISNIRKYLVTQLKAKTETTASAVDFDRCSVRVVKSGRAGLGKSLYKKRMVADLDKMVRNITRSKSSHVTIPLHEKTINIDDIMDVLLQETLSPNCKEPRIFHIDISHEVQEGIDALLFQLLILGCVGHSSGYVWRKAEQDYYIIESMPLLARDTDTQEAKFKCLHSCIDLLPHIICRSPQESLDILISARKPPDYTDHDRLFDAAEFKSATFQRPYQYLKRLDTNCRLDDVKPNFAEGDEKQCLTTLLTHCGIKDPSWSELYHFVSFLNIQLQDFEGSAFCGLAAVEDLPGFAKFVLRFLIQMSRDFSTRSLIVSEESPVQTLQRQMKVESSVKSEEGDNLINLYQMRRGWETSPHPYLFFNADHHSMTFLGFNIERTTGNLIDQQTETALTQGIMQDNLFDALVRNSVNLSENFDNLTRIEKIKKLCNVMGLDIHDPDESYELTTDNVKKILAIHMRFRCGIPVIIMGETGCGKTRLIKFMCSLQAPPGVDVENMILMKVHGGTKAKDIIRKVKKAEEIATKNAEYYPHMDTVLFFDEANATEAIGVIKEIMCDKSLGGKLIQLHERLKIVAACNPYRKHSAELIKRLEQAGLGYHVDVNKTADKLGHVPMRRLVYRVQPLPKSVLPLVWDFGQLNTDIEEMYIKQMVKRYVTSEQSLAVEEIQTAISKILRVSQDFMKAQKDECSFVSLRDVERVLQVMGWFYRQSKNDELLFQYMRKNCFPSDKNTEKEGNQCQQEIDDVTRSLVLALGVCYHACLKNRKEYRETVAKYFTKPLYLPGGADQIEEEISRCQSIFLENVELDKNIAKNQALKENVFMMVVCIELRIPMFLVGKPGSSKSLAKTVVADAMQGNAARKDLFKNYKQAQMVSFQCSPLSTPEGIVGTFRQCSAYQKDKNLDRFVSIVVLDEIGLAEDSPRMPLKTLHPLLEDGCPDDEEPAKYKKVAFIGISNWALDPAKMNRGILVQREVPDVTELIESAEGICSSSKEVLNLLQPMIPLMANAYLDLFVEVSKKKREFFGLRDFYSLLKMLYGFVSVTKKKPTWLQLKHSILRNFGGLENVKPAEIFYYKLNRLIDVDEKPKYNDPDCSSAGMINACLTRKHKSNSESRYLLLLTENYGALTILQHEKMDRAVVIFGSSFPSDQEYTQVCRNINRIKVCMETGRTVILLNLENLYESLYDVLNQSYVYFGGEKYVDLGLGTHRVKCKVHTEFRLIVVAEKQIVYNKFPIPLINRLEKHFLSLKTILASGQLKSAQNLQDWAQDYCKTRVPTHLRQKQKQDGNKIGDAFVGYNEDTCAAIILNADQERKIDQVHGQSVLLWCATPESVLQFSNADIIQKYFHEQHHESLADYLQFKIISLQQKNLHSQITTNSKLLSRADLEILCRFTNIRSQNITLLTLQSFDTEQQFCRQIKSSFDQSTESDMLLIVQCDSGDQNEGLIACARYIIQRELQQVHGERIHAIHVVFIIQLPSIAGGCFTGFQCGLWHSAHIDDIHPAQEDMLSVAEMQGKSVSELLTSANGFQIENLIKECIQPALGNIKDHELDSSRAVDRLKIFFKYLQPEQGKITIMSGITKHLLTILQEKEQNIGLNKNWLSSEASKPENINRAGTFRKFALQCFKSKIIPVLAGLIAFIDTNKNLDILTRNNSQDWTVRLWLEILNSLERIQLNNSSMVSSFRQQEPMEVAVKTTSKKGTPFSAGVPFSWLIFSLIEEVLKGTINSKNVTDNHSEVVMKAAKIYQDLPMGIFLSTLEESQFEKFLKSYIADFVHMIHHIQSDAECRLVCESVLNGCRQLIGEEFGRVLPSLVGCHMAYNMHHARFKNFSQLVYIWPQCSQKILDFQQEESNCYLITDEELTLDILALHVLLKHLEPSKDALNKPETRTKWLRQFCDFRPIVERLFSHFVQDTKFKENQYGNRCQRGIEQARSQWTRAIVMKLFIDFLCTTGEEDINREYALTWQTLKDCASMKDVESLEKVEKRLKNYCKKRISSRRFGGQIQNCQDYIRRCNSFFMEVVSQMYFNEETPPSQEVVQKLLSYITGYVGGNKVMSKELTIFDDAIDSTPVVRSFLLQQLMQTSGPDIDKLLSAYFENARKLLSGNSYHLVELCVLVLHCMEDALHQHFANREDEITMTTKILKDALAIKPREIETLKIIDYISKIRFSLTIVAKYIHKQFGGVHKACMPDANTRNLFDAAAKLCDDCGSEWPRRFFVKQLCRCYGIDIYQRVVNSEKRFLQWVCVPELKDKMIKKKCQDRYIVTGDDYKQLRETIVTTALNKNCQTLEQMLQQPENEWQTRIKLLLAIHREITMNNVYDGGNQKFTNVNKDFLAQFVLNHKIVINKEIAKGILNNSLWKQSSNITPGMDLAQQNLFCLLTHILLLMTEIPGNTTLMTPLRKIALDPQSMMNSFYPTMPQDDLAEIKESLLAALRQGDNPVLYQCPNGHPYVIGNCGQAASVGICKECGRKIGGKSHVLRYDNAMYLGIDRTEKGHVLGRAASLGPINAPERKLNRASLAVLRLLTHASMYLGANLNPGAVCQSIKPHIKQTEVAQYVLEHIDLDLASLQNVLGKNKDDILVLIHFLLARIMDEHNTAVKENYHNNICGLLDKASRSYWEEKFANRYIQPVLQDMDKILIQCNNKIINDKRLGSDPLLQILYETDQGYETKDTQNLRELAVVWRYRATNSLNHLRQMVDSSKLQLRVLRLFLDEDHHLRAIRFVPSIIRLHKMLIQKYGRRLDRAEATTLTIDQVKEQIKQERRLTEFEALLDDYTEAWNCVRKSLETHVFPANGSLMTVANKYCKSDITDKTPISQLLPTHKDAGLCSYALLFFLLKKQNRFLQKYCMETKQIEDRLPKVHVKDISLAHLISYHPDRELLPMLFANCSYSFEVGQGTRLEYNFANLERQLMDRFLFSKSIITGLTEIETITYRSESTSAVVFQNLCEKIRQERLNPAVQTQIHRELNGKAFPDLCDSLDKLDIAISFLKSVGSNPDSSLYKFMTNTLKMVNPIPSPKAQHICKCKHTMSLWMTLALERAKFLAKYERKAFEGISDNFKNGLTDRQVNIIRDILSKLPIEQIDTLEQLIFECIVLRVDVPQNVDDEDYVDMSKISLRDAIFGYLDACPYEEELQIDDTLKAAIGLLPAGEDPNKILTGQSVEVWNLVNKVFTQKQKQRH